MYLIQTVSFSIFFMAITHHSVVYLWTWFFHKILAHDYEWSGKWQLQVMSVSFKLSYSWALIIGLLLCTEPMISWLSLMYTEQYILLCHNGCDWPCYAHLTNHWLSINFRDSNFYFVVEIPNGCFQCRLQGVTTHKIHPIVKSMRM